MSEQTNASLGTGRELLPVFTADEVRRLVIQLTTLAGHVPSAADQAEELIALLNDRMAPSGVLKRFALWISPWQGGQLLYRITRRDRPGVADEFVARFVSEPKGSDEAIAFGRAKATGEYDVPDDELDIHPLALPKPGTLQERGASRSRARGSRWGRVKV